MNLNLPKIKTLEEVHKEYSKQTDPINFPIPENINELGPSELNRLYTMISAADGSINQRYLRDLQAHINSLPPRSALRAHYNNEQLQKKLLEAPTIINQSSVPVPDNVEKNKLPRSRLIDQFYSHQLPGIESKSLSQVRKLIDQQKQLRESAKNTTELLKMATKKLAEAFPDVPHTSLGIHIPSHHDTFQEDEQNNTNSKIPKCPLRFMESSIAIVLEHTEHLSIDLKRHEFEPNQE